MRMLSRRRDDGDGYGSNNIKKTEEKAQSAPKTGHNFCRIGLPEVGQQGSEGEGERVESRADQGDAGNEVEGLMEG